MSGWLELLAEYPRDREVSFDEAKSFVDKVEAQAVLDAGESSFAGATGDEEAAAA